MRVRRLSLDRFGHLKDLVFDFGAQREASDFHVILGANEAGKTTTMEGYLRLLFGFPRNEPYAFQYERKNLRVSGVLELNEEERSFTRLSQSRSNLLDDHGNPVSETAISSHLAALDIDSYRKLLCLDDETIEQGGEEIANAKGEVGRILFSASSGVADLTSALEAARIEAEEIYKKRGRTTRMATLKHDRVEAIQRIKEADVTASLWRRLQKEAKEAEESECEARSERNDLQKRKKEAEGRLRALPDLRERDGLAEEIVDFADYPVSISIDPKEILNLATQQGAAEANKERLMQGIANAEKELSGIDLDQGLLALAESLESTRSLSSRVEAAVVDLPRRRGELQNIMQEMARLVDDLGAPNETEVTAFVIPEHALSELDRAWKKVNEAEQRCAIEETEVASIEERVQESSEAVGAQSVTELEPAVSVEGTGQSFGASSGGAESGGTVSQAVAARGSLGELLDRFGAEAFVLKAAKAEGAVKKARESFEDALAELGVSDGELPDCPVDLAAAEDLAQRYERIADEADTVRRDLDVQREEVASKKAGIKTLESSLGLDGEVGVDAARAERDALWQAYNSDPDENRSEAFEVAMRRADEVADSHIQHATELGQLREMERDRAEAGERVLSKENRLTALSEELKEVKDAVATAAQATGVSISSPTALVRWVTKYGEAAQAARELERIKADHEPTIDKAVRFIEALRSLIPLEAPNLEEAVMTAREIANEEQARAVEAKAATERLAKEQKHLRQRQANLDKLKKEAKAASEHWNSRVAETFGGVLDAAVLGQSLSLLHALRVRDAKREQVEHQVTSMEEDRRDLAEKMNELAKAHGVAMNDPHEAFKELSGIVAQAKEDRDRHDQLLETIKGKRNELAEANDLLRGIDNQRQQLGSGFPESTNTDTLEGLRQTVAKAVEVIEKRKDIARLETGILAAVDAPDLDTARAKLEGATETNIKAEIDGIESDLAQADERLSQAASDRGASAQKLKSVSGEADVAEIEEHRATIEMEMEETAQDYLERRFGLLLAEKAIRRYRETHRSGMMEATQSAFSKLTGGVYQRLAIESVGKGGADILMATHANGSDKRVDGLSKGTRFQLYLALRAAAYMELVEQGVRLPFLCDDVFETFDDQRTKAACRLMEQIGRKGQAIYLTHHHHVVDIAEKICQIKPVIHKL